MESSEDIYQQSPPALVPIFSTEKHNQPIQLYEGSLKITQTGTEYEGNGTVFFEWLPSPNVKFKVSIDDKQSENIKLGQGCLTLSEIAIPVEIKISRIALLSNYITKDIAGGLIKPLIRGAGQNLSHIIFHLSNFYNLNGKPISTLKVFYMGRLILEAGGWSISIDKLENFEDIIKSLESEGGYAITHVGKLQRTDNTSFTAEEAEDILEALRWFLSFSRGFWTSPILLVGYSSGGEKVWEKWSADKNNPWQHILSWFPTRPQDEKSLSSLFPYFLRRWQNNTWNEPIRLAIHWYLESNSKAGGIQGSIVLIQAAFELLAWTLIVEEKKIISQDAFEKLPAADKLRILLSQCSVPLAVPNSLTNLLKVAREYNWVDGAQALIEIRNAIVHSNPKKRQKVLNRAFEEQIEAYELGIWYLELILLNLFEYKGEYWNRIAKKQWYGENIEFVPWS